MIRRLILLALASAAFACASPSARDDSADTFERATRRGETNFHETKARANLASIESAMADYIKAERKIPEQLTDLVPKYIASLPSVDLPACGSETDRVQNYGPGILRDGAVDGTRLKGTGRWGYVHGQEQVVIFIDCLKPSSAKLPWYQERGVY